MTGPAGGKLKLGNAKVILIDKKRRNAINAVVYIHLKGYARAKVTHLDIESEELNEIISGKGKFLPIYGTKNGFSILIGKDKYLTISHELLKSLIAFRRKTIAWIGSKLGGIYIGFRKEFVIKLEQIARKEFNIKPR